MKWVKRLLAVLLVLIVVAVVAASLFLGSIIKTSVNTVGPKVMGVPVKLDGARFSLLTGHVKLSGLEIGNPEGFKTPSAMKLGDLEIKLNVPSLLSNKIIIERIHVGAPQITYERGLKDSNLSKLLAQIQGEAKPEEKPKEEEPAPAGKEEGGQKVQINDFLIENARLNLSITGLGGNQLPIPLPPIHLKDIGKEKEGASVTEVISQVLNAILKSAGTAATAAVDLVGKGAEKAGEIAAQGVEKASAIAGQGVEKAGELAGKGVEKTGELAGKGIEKTGELGKKGVEVAGDAAEAAGETAKKGAKAIGEGASKLVGGVTGLFGKDKGQEQAPPPAEEPKP
ncbi:MAG: AsmA family protein [Verrucomicrobiota bacterium]